MKSFYIAHRNVNAQLAPLRHVSAKLPEPKQAIDAKQEYEIQILDEAGRSAKTLYFSANGIKQTATISEVPDTVLEAVRNLPAGVAVYVDESGHEASSF